MTCSMCLQNRHSRCAGLRFTVSGIPFKPDPQVSCSCRDCDRTKERWIWCDRCRARIAHPTTGTCDSVGCRS